MSREGGGDQTTIDAFLGGALQLKQPRSGYRAGVDAVLLAAAAALYSGKPATLLDIGSGVGTAGLCVARRVAEAEVVLFEREPAYVDLAHQNIAQNGLEERVRAVGGDIAMSNDALATLGLMPDSFDHVIANPPFHTEGQGHAAPDQLKARAHAMPADRLEAWGRFAARMAAPGGTVTMIHKAEALGQFLAALDRRFGAMKVLPIHARAAEPAIRVIIQGVKGNRAPLQLLPPFILHNDDNTFSAAAAMILRCGASLLLESPVLS